MARPPLNREELVARMAAGEEFQFFFFWGHTPSRDDSVDRSCLSQWYQARFTVDGISYPTVEHWMMAEKARLFGDTAALPEILAATTPKEAKALGRKVQGFDSELWSANCVEIVVRGNLAKFGQNQAMQEYLLSTGTAILVEAAPGDQIWGIGLGASNDRASQPAQWRGRNLLGFALMQVREKLHAVAATAGT